MSDLVLEEVGTVVETGVYHHTKILDDGAKHECHSATVALRGVKVSDQQRVDEACVTNEDVRFQDRMWKLAVRLIDPEEDLTYLGLSS